MAMNIHDLLGIGAKKGLGTVLVAEQEAEAEEGIDAGSDNMHPPQNEPDHAGAICLGVIFAVMLLGVAYLIAKICPA